MGLLELQVKTRRAWEEWMRAPERSTLPAALQRCWRRARRLGVRPESPAAEAVVGHTALAERRGAAGALLEAVPEHLAPVFGGLSALNFRVLLADADGTVLHAAGGGDFSEHADAVRLIAGSVWSESLRGTNAIGTALREQRPVAVLGAAHFVRANHGLACYAAPIRDPYGGLCGVLDATSFASAPSPLAAVTVLAAAGTLEAALRRQAWAALPASTGLIQRLMGRFPGPALLIERPGRISRANPLAAARLSLRTLPGEGADGLDVVVSGAASLDWEHLAAAAQSGRRARIAGQPADLEPLRDGQGRLLAIAAFLRQPVTPPAPPRRADPFRRLVGSDPQLCATRQQAHRLAETALPILLLAETGTGKGLLAQAIHDASPRSTAPFVALNCGALSSELLMTELFGHAPHAFTGAAPGGRPGRLAEADGGTLFLDEVAEMSPQMQAALLRFLEDGVYRPVGGGPLRRANVRLISATCRDLQDLIAQGRFRADLFYRLCGAPLSLPPLRARTDLLELARALLRQLAAQEGSPFAARLSDDAVDWLVAQPWPGNVRQLKSALHCATVLADGAPLAPRHFPALRVATAPAAPPAPTPAEPSSLADAESLALQQALAETGGNISATARTLGVARSTVYRLMERYSLR